MNIIRWDPFRDLTTLRERMNRLFEEAYTSRGDEKDLVSSTWNPSVDIYEKENAIILKAELPGIDENDIELKIEDSTLTLKGDRKFEKETKEENYHRIERSYGSFYRSFTLPRNIDQDKIKAESENGILKVTLPKKAELKPKKVKILKPKSASKNQK
ncbi:MAG: Hsp20/alpha crystallin family protein [Candidatus Aminicenantes bacterium]|jgi:HSP20 family protein